MRWHRYVLASLAIGSVALGGMFLRLRANAAETETTKIRPGTALAQLVAGLEQQHLTAAAAPTTSNGRKIKIEIPPWLRAHYMRNHPQVLTAANAKDPTGGFPLALENLGSWMLRHQDLQPPPAPEAAANVGVWVGSNIRISGQSNGPRSESDIRINVGNVNQIIAASNDIQNGRQAQFFSADGGMSWGQTSLPLLPGDSLHSDPTVDWTSDGKAWATTIGISAGGASLQMRAYKSTDGGKNWTFDGTFSGDQTSADKQLMWVDHSAASPHKDNIYVIWHNNRPAFVNRRTPAGWGAPLQVSGNETTGTAIGSAITTNAAGDVFAVWPDTGSQKIFVVKSTDGGVHYSAPAQISKTFGSFQIGVPSFASRRALIGVSIAAFSGNGRNDVYVTWVDLAGDAGCDTPDSEPGTDVNSSCKTRVWFSRSADGGTTWSTPVKVNDPNNEKSDQFNQRLAVDPESGLLGLVYYQTGTGPNRNKTNLVFQASSNNGGTWSSPTKVASESTDETADSADSGNQYGDYNGLSMAKDVCFPCWTDRRNNAFEEIFSAQIKLDRGPDNAVKVTVTKKD